MPQGSPSSRDFFRFYGPLAATSLLLTSTNPVLAAALARTASPSTALAGYSVAFALAGVLYAPLLAVQQVAAARIVRGRSAAPVRRFALAAGLLFSVPAFLAAFTPVGVWVFRDLIGVRGPVLEEALSAMALLWPVPLLTAVRAFHQGRLVAGHATRPIAAATAWRTAVLAGLGFVLAALAGGAWVGGMAFSAGLAVETVLVGIARAPLPLPGDAPEGEVPVLAASTPLMLNVVLWWGTPLVINAVLARTPDPEIALAGFAVVEAVAWFLAAPVGQLQHASIALVDGDGSHRRVRAWAGVVAGGSFLLLVVLALPPVWTPVLQGVFDLDRGLLGEAGRALPLAAAYPLLYGHRQYYQGLFIRAGRPGLVGWGAVLRMTVIVLLALAVLEPLGHWGAALGVGLAVAGLGVEGLWLERLSHSRALPALAEAPPPAHELAAP